MKPHYTIRIAIGHLSDSGDLKFGLQIMLFLTLNTCNTVHQIFEYTVFQLKWVKLLFLSIMPLSWSGVGDDHELKHYELIPCLL